MIEIIRSAPVGPIRSALLDFDGTLSLIREGWQDVMISFMIEILEPLDSEKPQAELENHIREYVTRLTGKQTIYQMIQLADEVRERGGTPEEPLLYKRQYNDRLWEVIRERVEGLESGKYRPEDWLVTGCLDLLENLNSRGVTLYLASGTDEAFVKREADLLGLTRFFDGRIYGALDHYRLFSKKMIIGRVLTEEGLKGSDFVAFGDGYVEIENTKEVGGTAVGVATEERLRSGLIDQWKHQRLLAAGADIIVPDFAEQNRLVAYLTGEERP